MQVRELEIEVKMTFTVWKWKDSISFVSGIYCGVKGHWRNSVWFVHATGYNRMGFMKIRISQLFLKA